MAFPHPLGLLPAEVAFLCELELVTVVPRQRLDRLDLLGGPIPALVPPQRSPLPLWLALLLKRQRRANILPPLWLSPTSLAEILELETTHFQDSFSPAPPLPPVGNARRIDAEGKAFIASAPFLETCTDAGSGRRSNGYGGYTTGTAAAALPYHWFEVAEILLDAAADDLAEPDSIRRLLRDIREVRLAKMRKGIEVLGGDGEGVRLDGVGAMEVSESRGLITGVVDGLRKIGASREAARRETEVEEREVRGRGRYDYDNDDDGDGEDDEMS